jgi:hypothetical protein
MAHKSNKPRRIPFKARRLIREVISGKHKSIKSAGEAAGYGKGNTAYRALAELQGTISEIMDSAGLTDRHLVEKCIKPLLHAKSVRFFQADGEILESRLFADHDTRIRALDIALRIKGKYTPLAVEQARKDTVEVIILDAPRPKRDIPPPTRIEIARTAPSQNVLPQPRSSASQQPTNVLPHNGNGSNGGKV